MVPSEEEFSKGEIQSHPEADEKGIELNSNTPSTPEELKNLQKDVQKKVDKVQKDKASTKKEIEKTKSKIKETKSKVKDTKDAVDTLKDFKKKHKK